MIYKIDEKYFDLKDTFECGQTFRWNKKDDDSYEGIIHKMLVNVEKVDGSIVFKIKDFENLNEEQIEEKINKYFDLDRDYESLRNKVSKIDDNLKQGVYFGKGIRILNQDLWETIISFIISANNNIPRIKKIIESLCKNYGEKMEYEGKIYYSFPTPKELSKASGKDLHNLKLGFRDIRVYETTQKILKKQVNLENLYKLKTDDARNELLKLDGVGEKVADCILLFSDLKRFDVFPIDVWVRRIMNNLYFKKEDEAKLSKRDIKKLADEKFGELEGLAQQYLFYFAREHKI